MKTLLMFLMEREYIIEVIIKQCTYAKRFFWKSQLKNLRKKFTLLGEKGKEVSEFIKEKYHLE
ncbi:MAG: hypothetical protein U5N85_00090 [Arcicella sp.]|nr:hypothetical protein [Arcicella sp.]